jgi:hypothetical protein
MRAPHVSIERVKFTRHGRWLVTRAWIRNARTNWWAPTANVRFAAVDRLGHVVATYVSRFTLRPARTASVIAPSFLLPLGAGPVSRVAVSVHPGTWRWRASYARPNIRLGRFRIQMADQGFVVKGVAHHTGRNRLAVVVGCNGRTRRSSLTGSAVGLVVLPAWGTAAVRIHIPHAAPGTVAGGCRVMGWSTSTPSAD